MALIVQTVDSIGLGTRIDLSTTDDLHVAQGVTIRRTDGSGPADYAVRATGSNQRIEVLGTVQGARSGIQMGNDFNDSGNTLEIGAGGTIRALGGYGVFMFGSDSTILNAGTIDSSHFGVVLYAFGGTTSTINNSGTISSVEGTAVYGHGGNDSVTLTNSGTIRGLVAYEGASLKSSKVINSGLMIGRVGFGGGDDRYDGSLGAIEGTVFGEFGNDVLIGGAGVETFDGGDGNDRLFGNGGNDRLIGGEGDDILDGGTGTDIMKGGNGNDTYHVDTAADTVDETGVDGVDTVFSSVSYSLSSVRVKGHVENLTLTGTAADATGNALANVLVGNSQANVLDGREGADTMKGGRGNDTYHVDTAGDVVDETGGSGTDTVIATVTYNLASSRVKGNVENLTLDGTAKINATGNALANVLVGNAATNRIDGGAGNDRIDGGGGKDVLTGGAGADIFIFSYLADSGNGARADVINNFRQGDRDRIDLTAIDARAGTRADDKFAFIGTAAFSGAEGELRFQAKGGKTYIYGDVNGDGKADFSIVLLGEAPLKAADFLL